MILITDGRSQVAPQTAAMELRDAGIILITVGVGNNVDMATLDEIASQAADGSPLSFQIDDFGDIGGLLIDEVVRSIGELPLPCARSSSMASGPHLLYTPIGARI